jgi:3-hydroxyisobutyrate dehydrogenase-like beta-hydroxyacid dehydrogenase
MDQVAFLGLGAMGQRMVANLLEDGHKVFVWNRTAKRCDPLVKTGAIACETPYSAAQNANIVVAIVADDEASKTVWRNTKHGALKGMQAGSVAIECSTLSLGWCKELAITCQNRGINFLDAPVAGSRPQAEARQLIHLVGGENQTLEQVRHILEANATTIHHIGHSGSGMATKLAANALFGVQLATLGELMNFLKHNGIETQTAATFLSALHVASPVVKRAIAAIAANNYTPRFALNLAEKDLRYTIDSAQACGTDIPVTTLTQELFAQAIAEGYGDENIHAIAKIFS